MKKILFVVESLSGGGAEKVLLTLVKNLNKEKYDITVFTIVETGIYVNEMKKYCQVKSALKDYNEYSTVGRLYYKIKMKLIYNLDIKFVYRWLIKKKYDIEIAFVEGFDTKLVAASNNKNSKKYAWVHIDMIANSHADIHFKNLLEEQTAYRKYDKIFTVSNYVKKVFEQKYSMKNVFVQYNAIDENEIISKSKEYIVTKNQSIQLITLGRLVNQKGYDRLLCIVLKLRNMGYDNFNIWILGDGEKKNEYEKFIFHHKLENYITLLGFKKNPYPYILSSDAFICSSRSEGFSTVATEALILEKPIFTVECAGMNELFGKYKCGKIVKNDDEHLFELLKEVLDNRDDFKEYKDEIQERKKFFSLSKRIKEMEKLLDE